MIVNVEKQGLKILVSAVRFRPRPPVKSLTGIENPAIFLVAGFFVALPDVTADVRGFQESAPEPGVAGVDQVVVTSVVTLLFVGSSVGTFCQNSRSTEGGSIPCIGTERVFAGIWQH